MQINSNLCAKCAGKGKVLAEGSARLHAFHVDCPACGGNGLMDSIHDKDLESSSDSSLLIKRRGRPPKTEFVNY